MPSPNVDARKQIIRENFIAFEAMLPSILIKHGGKSALLHNRQITAYFDSPKAAILQGKHLYPAQDFSVQKVESQVVDLGWYSHA